MNAKIYKDGDRIIVSFEGVNDAEDFLQKVVKIVTESSGANTPVQDVLDLDPPSEDTDNTELFADSENGENAEEKEPETKDIEDFPEPFVGKTPSEIMNAPQFEGFYYLCRAAKTRTLPSQYEKESKALVVNFIGKLMTPPYGDAKRMKAYLRMAQNMLGADVIPDHAYQLDDKEWLETACQTALSEIQKFVSSIS